MLCRNIQKQPEKHKSSSKCFGKEFGNHNLLDGSPLAILIVLIDNANNLIFNTGRISKKETQI
tara:strand:- start:174 stop:362 length:189 start_codon:yes stop_codon:yes gene_type:complete